MKTMKSFGSKLAALTLGIALAGTVAAASPASASAGPSVRAKVVSIRCEATGGAQVKLAAISNASNAMFAWDFTSDGSLDTTPSASSRAVHDYGRTATNRITATVEVTGRAVVVRDSVTFTLSC